MAVTVSRCLPNGGPVCFDPLFPADSEHRFGSRALNLVRCCFARYRAQRTGVYKLPDATI